MDIQVILLLILYGVVATYANYLFWKHNFTIKFKPPFDKGKWRRILFLLVCLIPLSTYSQNTDKIQKDLLPIEIKQYYKNLNLANSLSTPTEKSALVKYLQTGNSNQAPTSKRQTFVMNLLKDVMQKEIKFQPAMPNASNTGHLYSRLLLELQHGYKEEDFMAIRIEVYQLSVADNFKIISLYDEDKDAIMLDGEIDNLSTPKYMADEIHEWIFENNRWVKKEVRKVLVK